MKRLVLGAVFALAAACHSRSSDAIVPVVDAAAVSAAPAASIAPASKSTSPATAVLREERTVTVDGVEETWRLEWRRPPLPSCMGDDWYTCPCNGEEFGEKGSLDLVRARPGEGEERLSLDALFEERDATLPRWQVDERERKSLKVPTQPELQKRALVKVMNVADYDHDGRATEFPLQVGSTPCGHQASVLVGIDRKNPKLHVFLASTTTKDDWMVLRPTEWDKVKEKVPQEFVELACGDHGSDEENSVRVTADDAGLHLTRSSGKCP